MNRIPATARLSQIIFPGIALALALISGCAGSPATQSLNTLKKIDRPAIVYEAPSQPEIILHHHTAEFLFAPGNYSSFDNNDLLRAVAYLNQNPGPRTLTVEGHSYSNGSSATERLALKRSQVVVDALVAQGIDSRTIRQVGIYANHVPEESPFSGAKLHWVSAPGSTQNVLPVVQTIGEVASGDVAATGGQPNQAPALSDVESVGQPSTDQESPQETVEEELIIPEKTTYEVNIESGSLKASVITILEDHGYTLGIWEFGYTTDWEVEKGYNYNVEGDIIAVLETLNRTYGILGTLNELDKTVDFEASPATGGNDFE